METLGTPAELGYKVPNLANANNADLFPSQSEIYEINT